MSGVDRLFERRPTLSEILGEKIDNIVRPVRGVIYEAVETIRLDINNFVGDLAGDEKASEFHHYINCGKAGWVEIGRDGQPILNDEQKEMLERYETAIKEGKISSKI